MKLTKLAGLIIVLAACGANSEPIISMGSPVAPTALATVAVTAPVATRVTATAVPSRTPHATPNFSPTPTVEFTKTPLPTAEPLPFDRTAPLTRVYYPIPFGSQGSVVFIVQDNRLLIAELVIPDAPVVLWQSEVLGREVAGIVVADNRAYIYSDNELMIWNVKNRRQPLLLSRIPVHRQLYVDPANALVYTISFSGNEGQVKTIDIADFSLPEELGTAVVQWTSPTYYPFQIVDNHLFLVNEGSVEIVDLSNPNLPELIATISAPTNLNSTIEVVDELLYIVTLSGTSIVDWKAVEAIEELAHYSGFSAESVHTMGNRAYLFWQLCGWHLDDDDTVSGGCGYGLEVVDFSDPTQPQFEGVIRLKAENNQLWFDRTVKLGHLLYLESGTHSETENQVYVLDLSCEIEYGIESTLTDLVSRPGYETDSGPDHHG